MSAAVAPPGRLMDTGLRSKVALVSGASKGLGRAVAEALAREGARVAIVARSADPLRAAADAIGRETGSEVLPVAGDVSRGEDVADVVAQTVEHFGRLDVLVTNAGGPKPGTFATLTEADWREAIDLTLMSVIRLSMAAVPHFRRHGGGRIVHITSVAVKQPVPGLMLSNALRAAVVGFAKTLATELAPEGILVNCVAPGFTRTERIRTYTESTALREGTDAATVERRLVQEIPLGRMGEPYELGDLVMFLASDRAGYITGTTIQVDGGYARGII